MTSLVLWVNDSPFGSANWTDWADIGILALIIYRVILLMRGTRALQSLLGLLLLGVIYVASKYAGFTTIHWVLDHIFVYVVLALIILFQEDIRWALAQVGSTLFGRRPLRYTEARSVEEVIQAVFNLAKKRSGALIVLRRKGSLDPYVAGAHVVDAVVSHELIEGIFHPASALHDGALIISNQRIQYAGVFLPITATEEMPRALGTRHRAALCLSKVNDSVCLAVSEERGTVTVFYQGEILPVADSDELRHQLVTQLESSSPSTTVPERVEGAP